MPALLDRWGAEIEIVRQLHGSLPSYTLRIPKATLGRVLWACLEWHEDVSPGEHAEFTPYRTAVEAILSNLDTEGVVAPA